MSSHNIIKLSILILIQSKMLSSIFRKSKLQHSDQPKTENDLRSIFCEHLKQKRWFEAEATFRDILKTDSSDLYLATSTLKHIKKEQIIIDNVDLLRKLYGRDYSTQVYQHFGVVPKKPKTKHINTEINDLCESLRNDFKNQEIIDELLVRWDLNRSSKERLSTKHVVSLSNVDIFELFLGIDYFHEITSSDIFDAIKKLIQKNDETIYKIDNHNLKHISFLCDLLIRKGFKLPSYYDYQAIEILDYLCVWHPCLDYYLILNQKLGFVMNEKHCMFILMTCSKKHQDFSLVLHLLENNFSLFIGDLNWVSNRDTYNCPQIFAYFKDFIQLCSSHRKTSRASTELEIWEHLIGAGNMETIELFVPQMKEPNKISGFVANYDTLLFLADQNKHPLTIDWENLRTTDSFVSLWLHKNHNTLIDLSNQTDLRYSSQIFNIISPLPHALKHSNFEFFEQLKIPFFESLDHYLYMISSSFLEKIPIERLIAFLAIVETRREKLEQFVPCFIKVDLVQPLVYLFGDSVPKVQPKLKYLYQAIEKEKHKCSVYLINLFKDKMPNEIHTSDFSDVKGINKLCQSLNLSFRYDKCLNSHKLIKMMYQDIITFNNNQ